MTEEQDNQNEGGIGIGFTPLPDLPLPEIKDEAKTESKQPKQDGKDTRKMFRVPVSFGRTLFKIPAKVLDVKEIELDEDEEVLVKDALEHMLPRLSGFWWGLLTLVTIILGKILVVVIKWRSNHE